MDPPRWSKGDRVFLASEGQTIAATVLLASRNGRSVAFGYEGVVWAGGGVFVGMLPLLWEDGAYRTLQNVPCVVAVRPAP